MRSGLLLALALTALAYARVFTLGYAYDDNGEILYNRHVVGDATFVEIVTSEFTAGARVVSGLYRPAVVLAKRGLHALGGGSAAVHHAANLLLHLLVVALLYRWLRDHFEVRVAGAGAALFGVHPIGVEVVAANAGLKDLLPAACVLLLLVATPRARALAPAPRLAAFAGLLAAALVGAFSKESFAVALPLLAVQDLVRPPPRADTRRRRAALLALPYVACVLALALAWVARTLVSEAETLGGTLAPSSNPLLLAPPGVLLLTAGRLVMTALALAAVPIHLRSDYTYDVIPLAWRAADADAWAGLLLSAAVLAALGAGLWRRRRFALPLALVVIGWAPASQLLVRIPQIFAERFLYLPLLGLAALAALGGVRAADVLEQRVRRSGGPGGPGGPGGRLARSGLRPARALAVAFVLVLAALAARTYARVDHWRDETTFLYETAREAPRSLRFQAYVANDRIARGDPADAAAVLQAALGRHDPCPYTRMIPETDPLANRVLGIALIELGRLEEARRHLRRAHRSQPELLANAYELGRSFEAEGRPDEAIRIWEAGLSRATLGLDFASYVRTRLLEWYERRRDTAGLVRHWDALLADPRADDAALRLVRRQAKRQGDAERAERAARRLGLSGGVQP